MKIEGYFSTIKTAKEVMEKLKGEGFRNCHMDINDHYIDDRNIKTNLPGTETSVSLSGLVLESDTYGITRDKAPLTAASPMVSGYGHFEEIADINCKVVVEADDTDSEKARQIIREMGGNLESSNFKKPNIDNGEEVEIKRTLEDNRRFIDREGRQSKY